MIPKRDETKLSVGCIRLRPRGFKYCRSSFCNLNHNQSLRREINGRFVYDRKNTDTLSTNTILTSYLPRNPITQLSFVEVQRTQRISNKRIPRQQIPTHFLIDLQSNAAGAGITPLIN